MPDPFTTAELTRMRSTQAVHMPDTCAILSPTVTRASTGHEQTTWGTLAASAACRFVPTGLEIDRTVADMVQGAQTYVATIAYDGSLDPTYRLVYGGTTYEIVSVQETGSWKTAKRALAKVVQP